jgi:hypothetical protein
MEHMSIFWMFLGSSIPQFLQPMFTISESDVEKLSIRMRFCSWRATKAGPRDPRDDPDLSGHVTLQGIATKQWS